MKTFWTLEWISNLISLWTLNRNSRSPFANVHLNYRWHVTYGLSHIGRICILARSNVCICKRGHLGSDTAAVAADCLYGDRINGTFKHHVHRGLGPNTFDLIYLTSSFRRWLRPIPALPYTSNTYCRESTSTPGTVLCTRCHYLLTSTVKKCNWQVERGGRYDKWQPNIWSSGHFLAFYSGQCSSDQGPCRVRSKTQGEQRSQHGSQKTTKVQHAISFVHNTGTDRDTVTMGSRETTSKNPRQIKMRVSSVQRFWHELTLSL